MKANAALTGRRSLFRSATGHTGHYLRTNSTPMGILIRLIISAIAVLVTDLLLPGVSLGDMSQTNGLLTALLVAAVLGLLNAVLKPVLILLTLPVTVVTLGIFLLVINAVIVLIAANLIDGFTLSPPRFWWALGFSLLLSFITSILNAFDGGSKRAEE